jgi:hypothetical protein
MSFLRHGKSIDPMSGWGNAGSRSSSLPPALIGLDEFQLAIPWRGGLHQSPPPLHQPPPVCCKLASLVEPISANGKVSLNWSSHPRGQAQFVFAGIRFIPAALLIGLWFLSQLFHAGAVAHVQTGGVAYLAHIGGFIFGAATARWFEDPRRIA